MADPRFFRSAGPFTVAEIASRIGAELAGAARGDLLIDDVGTLERAGPSHLSFLSNPRYAEQLRGTKAGAVLVRVGAVGREAPETTLLVAADPYRSFARASQMFYPAPSAMPGVATSATVEPGATLGEGVSVGHHAVIGAGASIGPGTEIGAGAIVGPNCVIGAGCRIASQVTVSQCLIGDRVTLFPGVRVGQDGFGFAPGAEGHVKMPQLGRVVIGDDVEIGANSTVDRGALGDTIIGAGTMIDNLVQIAHNVVIGRGCVLVAQSGVSGSTVLGDFVMVGGQAAIVGHLSIGSGARVGGKSGVVRDVEPGQKVGGIPAVPIVQWHRQTVVLERLAKKKDK